MQKQEEIVSKLDKEEKLALAASLTATAEPWAEQSDIPRVNFYDFATENGGVYPDLSVLAQTLNTELVSDVMQDLAAKTEKKGLFCLNNMGVKDNPYRAGISEDPYVCGAAAEAAARGIRKAGMIPCFSGYVPASDSEEITLSQMREVFLSPLYSKPQRECTVYRENFPKNTDQSYSAWSKLLHSAAEKNGYIIDEKGSDLSAGNILLGGDKEILRAAAEKNGSQILDKAAEQAVGLALECAGGKVKNGESFDREKYALRAAEESVVLLKNKVVLPLMRSKKLAFIGLHKEDRRQAFEKAVNKDKYFQLAGFSEGYDLTAESGKDTFEEACKLAQSADAVLLFLDREPNQSRALLPANRLALLDEILKRNPNVIVFIPAGSAVDVSFAEKIPALFSAEWQSSQSAAAILNILSGKTCPSGRLVSALYSGTDQLSGEIQRHKRAGKIKTGNFYGYRSYDTAGNYPPYSFGFGLSYTKFSYSDLKIKDNFAEVTVKNTGKFDAWETVQLYAGKIDSAVVRPRKELIGFRKIFLRAGTYARISVYIDTAPLRVWKNDRYVVEGGSYDLFVASSVCDVKLQTRVNVAGERLVSDGEHLSDYIPEKSNILSGNYTLEQVQIKPVVNRRVTMKKVGLSFLFAAIALGILSIIFAAVCSTYQNDGLYNALMVILVCFFPQMLLTAIVLLIVAKKQAKNASSGFRTADSEAVSTYVPPEIVEDASYEALFSRAFSENQKKQTETESLKKDEDVSVNFDQNLTFSVICEKAEKYFSERGIVWRDQSVQDFFAAMAASRLVVVRSENEELLPRFLRMIGEFFGTEAIARNAAEEQDSQGCIANTMLSASKGRHQIFFNSWYNVGTEGLDALLGKYKEYVRFPYSDGASSNVWFVAAMRADADCSSVRIPSAVFVEIRLSACEEVQDPAPVAAVCYDQFEKLAALAHGVYCLDEEMCWKKVDALEKYAGKLSSFCLENKDWLRLEMFSSVCCACKAEQANALDRAISCTILVPMFDALRENGVTSDDFLKELLSVLGADGCPQCRKMLEGFTGEDL